MITAGLRTILDYSQGVHADIPAHLYHARILGLVSRSALEYVARSPAHYKAWVDGTLADEQSPALVFGAAFHCALLEPDKFAHEYAFEPDFGDCRFKENKAIRDDWRRENAGKTFLDPYMREHIRKMVDAIRTHALAGKIISDGQAELTVRWKDEDSGLECKVRGDYYVEKLGMLADVKTTLDASPDAFRRDIARYYYHRQAALYQSGFKAVGAPVEHFLFVCVEKSPPYAVGVYTLDENGIAAGATQNARLMASMAECMKNKTWPGYPAKIKTLELPQWAMAQGQ